MFPGVIDCDLKEKKWIELALRYLPDNIYSTEGKGLVFFSLGKMDACRLPHKYKKYELIIISDRIFPYPDQPENELTVKYFIFTVLHEVVHAIKKHRSPLFDKLSSEEIKQQEDEADELALTWFNSHVAAQKTGNLTPMTKPELNKAMEQSLELRNELGRKKIDWLFPIIKKA